jgi:hypothetical protein
LSSGKLPGGFSVGDQVISTSTGVGLATHGFRQKALLRAELSSAAAVVATGLDVVQQIHAPAGKAVFPQSAWLLRKIQILAHASKLVSRG